MIIMHFRITTYILEEFIIYDKKFTCNISFFNYSEKYPYMATNHPKIFVRQNHNTIDIVCNIDTEKMKIPHFADKHKG